VRDVATLVVAVAAAVLLQLLLPNRAIWHQGWYSVALVALVALLAVRARHAAVKAAGRARAAVVLLAFGGGAIAFSGVASGLLAPDRQQIVGAPGSDIFVPDLGGSLRFAALHGREPPALVLPGRAPLPIASQRYIGAFLVKQMMRTVVAVEARDAADAHLTITQPTGSAFSSPVLLMQQTQRISGLDLPFDAFSVPAAHRIVKVVLFSAQQVALMSGISGSPRPVVLFAVDDETDRPLPHAIFLANDRQQVAVGGLRLRATIVRYPAVELTAIPSLPGLTVGFGALALGLGLSLSQRGAKTPSRSKS